MTTEQVFALHLRADNDSSGNPRRCFAVFNLRGQFLEAIDEGYAGTGALYEKYPQFGPYFKGPASNYCFPVAVDVSVSEYKRFLRRDPVELDD